MLAIRFARRGTNKKPTYRIIVTEKSRDNFGKFLENLGHYNPKTKEAEVNAERINYWIDHGAQPSPTVHNFLITKGVIKGEKVRASKSRPGKKKQAAMAAVAAQKPAEPQAKPAETAAAPAIEKQEEKPIEVK